MADAWNTNWNNYWNQGYNAAAGQVGSGGNTSPVYTGDMNIPGAYEGWGAGIQEFYKRSPTGNVQPQNITTNPTVLGATTTGDQPPQSSGPSIEDILNQGYNEYLGNVDQMSGTLDTQRANQEARANEVYNAGAGQLGTQFGTGNEMIATNQKKSLRDIGDSIASGFKAGNVLLGSMGAGDSTAAQQMSYALAKEGSKERGLAMGNYDSQRFQLKQSYDQGLATLNSQRSQQIYDIANWFSQQQMTLQGMKASAAKDRSNQILSIAVNALQAIDNQLAVKKSNLEAWAMSQSTSLSQLGQNMQGISAYQSPAASQTSFMPSNSSNVAANSYFNNANTTDKNKLFGGINYNYLD